MSVVMEEKIMHELEKKIASKTVVIGVIGMGHIGLSFLDAFAKGDFHLIGYDTDHKKVEMLKSHKSYINHLELKELFDLEKQHRFTPTFDDSVLKKADVIVISVPTPLDDHQNPMMHQIESAFHAVRDNLRKGQLIILQGSAYPGVTERTLLPMLEQSKLKVGEDYFLTYVPEMFDIGNNDFTFLEVPRIVSGITANCLQMATLFYEKFGCKVVPCSSTQVAESAKLLQNAYRMVNISFINEMKIMFDHMGVDVWEVIEAAAVKPFGFTPFYPSAGAGGDCIPVCPAYLIWEAKETDAPTTLMEASERVNATIPDYVVNKTILGLSKTKKSINGAKILVLGVAYKKDVNDIRHSPALKILNLLREMHADVQYHDPVIEEVSGVHKYPKLKMRSVKLHYETLSQYDAVIIVADHSNYDWTKIVKNSQLVIDTRNVTAKVSGSKEKVIKA